MDMVAIICAGGVGIAGFGLSWGLLGNDLGVRFSSQRLSALLRNMTAARLGRKGKGRRNRVRTVVRDMPCFLDIVTLCISAGLSFDASIDMYCERFDTDLAGLLSDAMLSWRMGVESRADALDRLAREVDAPAMARFGAAVNDALAFGAPLAEALEQQAQVIREEQRAQVEEEIEQLPVRMLIPLATLIVPAMLISILGPLLGPALSMA